MGSVVQTNNVVHIKSLNGMCTEEMLKYISFMSELQHNQSKQDLFVTSNDMD